MKIIIQKGIPIPLKPKGKAHQRTGMTAILRNMEPMTDSFLYPASEKNRVKHCARNIGVTLIIRELENNKIRIWKKQ